MHSQRISRTSGWCLRSSATGVMGYLSTTCPFPESPICGVLVPGFGDETRANPHFDWTCCVSAPKSVGVLRTRSWQMPSTRELQVLQHLSDGLTTEAVARELYCPPPPCAPTRSTRCTSSPRTIASTRSRSRCAWA
jgi:hypothetical protein